MVALCIFRCTESEHGAVSAVLNSYLVTLFQLVSSASTPVVQGWPSLTRLEQPTLTACAPNQLDMLYVHDSLSHIAWHTLAKVNCFRCFGDSMNTFISGVHRVTETSETIVNFG